MAVHLHEVQPAIVVEVKESVAPADVGTRCGCKPCLVRDVVEIEVAIVAEEGGVLLAEVRDGNGEAPCVVIVSECDAHVGLLAAVLIECRSGLVGHVGELSVAVILIEVIGAAVVGDEEPKLTVASKVRPNRGQAEEMLGIVYASLF